MLHRQSTWSFRPATGMDGAAATPPDRMDFFPQLPAGLAWFRLEDCRFAEHLSDVGTAQIG